jgi:hypothetical protein
VAGITDTVATVLWHTDEMSTSRVDYGISSPSGRTASNAFLGFDHSVLLQGLTPGTTYRFTVYSEDGSGNGSGSKEFTFTTATAGNPTEVIVDDGAPEFSTAGGWYSGSSAGGWDGDYRVADGKASETASATWSPLLPVSGRYEVYVWYVAGSNRASDVTYTIAHASGTHTVPVDQKKNGKQWNLLGAFDFQNGTSGSVRVGNATATGGVVIADGVRWRLVSATP